MNGTRVAVVGRSVHMAGLAASLKANPALQIVRVNPDSPSARQAIDALAPDVVIFDLIEPCPDLTISLLRERPGLLLLGMDPSRDEMLVLAGRSERAQSVQDLLQVVHRKEVPEPEGPKEELPSRGKPNIVYNQFQSKQTQFIPKENKMKNLSKRNKTLLAIVGGVAVLVIAVLVLGSVGGRGLFGTSGLIGTATFDITPANPTIDPGASVQLCASGRARWETSNVSVAAITAGADKLIECIDVKGMAKGDATITAHGSPYGISSAQTNVKVK